MKKLILNFLMIAFVSVFAISNSYAGIPISEKVESNEITSNSRNVVVEKDDNKDKTIVLKKDRVKSKRILKLMKAMGDNKVVGAVLAFFLGGFGAHRFYYGDKKMGLIMLGLTILGIVLIIVGAAGAVGAAAAGSAATAAGGGALALIGSLLISFTGIWGFVDFIRILVGSYPNS